MKVGGIRMTSVEALVRFFERLDDPSAEPDAITPSLIRHEHDRAEAELAAAGI